MKTLRLFERPLVPGTLIERKNRGNYILVAHLENKCTITIGAAGNRRFNSGYYVYSGFAQKNLQQRIARHRRKQKKLHWHIDYLLRQAQLVKSYIIKAEQNYECAIAGDLARIADDSIPAFGSSDCRCPGHLYYFKTDPRKQLDFINILFDYRFR